MILQALYQLYDRLSADPAYEIAQPGFSPQKIAFRIVLEPDGTLFGIEDARTPDDKGRLQNTVMEVPGTNKPSGSGINPCLLWDNQTYLLGKQPEDKDADFALKRFSAFRDYHLPLESQINSPDFSAVCRFLNSWSPERLGEFPILNEVGTGFGVFQIRGQKHYVHDTHQIRKWWKSNQPQETSEILGQCLISGVTNTPIARLHPQIKGVSGAQSSGAAIVSFNAKAYESYGHIQSYNAPVSTEATFNYTTALNALLQGPMSRKHRVRIGDTTCVFWTEQPSDFEDCFADLLGEGSNAIDSVQDETQLNRLKRLIQALHQGTRFVDEQTPPSSNLYILGLSPNAARLAVRFFYQTTIDDIVKKLHAHQQCLQIIREFTEPKNKRPPDPELPAIWQLLNQTARVSDEIPPLLGGALTRAILQGTKYPEGLYSAVIRRIRADRNITYLRAAILKAVLIRNHQTQIPIMLDPTERDPAYLLGRLFAALEKTQEDALPGINATIRDRFYSSASATPASVFPKLLRTYQHHLANLSPGAKINRERLIQDIIAALDSKGFPPQLDLIAQGRFAIGYYHQRKDLFTSKKDPSES